MPLAKLTQDYLQGPHLLRQAVAGMKADDLLARPFPDKWSTLEVVAHIADFEPILAERIKRVIALDNPTFFGACENKFAKALGYHNRDLEEELTIIEKTRSQLVKVLRELSEADLQRVGTHSEKGPKTLEQLIQTAINHIPHHLKFIQEKRAALGV